MMQREPIPEWRTIRSLGVHAPGECYFFQYDEGPPPEGHFRIETLYTGLSAGTELTFFKGTNPYLHSRWNEAFGVFVSGEVSAQYPMPFLGYMEVGRVIESRTPVVAEGQVVAMSYGHKTGHTAHPAHEFFVAVPPEVDPLLGIYVAQMGPICANGLLHAAADLYGTQVQTLGDGVRGRNILVIGGGVIGLFVGLWARHFGAANVALADSTPRRLDAARALGLDPIDERTADVAFACKERWHNGGRDRGADLVFQCRGQAASLQMALRALRPQGTVIDLAFYQGGAPEIRLGEEFHHNGLRIQCAQIERVPRGLAYAWGKQRLAHETLALLQTHGAAIRNQIITDVVPFDEAPRLVAELAERKRDVIQAVFQVAA